MKLHFSIVWIVVLTLGASGGATAGVVNGCDDGDTVPCASDNCMTLPQFAGQFCDDDQDGYGNMCDADLDNSGAVGPADFGLFQAAWGQLTPDPADFDCSGAVGPADFGIFQIMWGLPPGPSGLSCAGMIPCP